jgi:DNA-binding MarR family transcriptional regulator
VKSSRRVSAPDRLARAAYAFHAGVERALRDALLELDLTLPLADAIWQLDPAVGPLSRRELAPRLACDPSNVTFLINRLQERRLVARAPGGDDRRLRLLMLTPSGARARNGLIAALAGSSMFTRLTAAQQRQLTELLGRCVRT